MPASIEVKLVDVPDPNYFSSHNPPQGEIWIRGVAVIDGYLDNPEENAKAFQEGWFKTGDIRLFDATGQLKIIDHKKNLVKTLNAERGVYRIGEKSVPLPSTGVPDSYRCFPCVLHSNRNPPARIALSLRAHRQQHMRLGVPRLCEAHCHRGTHCGRPPQDCRASRDPNLI